MPRCATHWRSSAGRPPVDRPNHGDFTPLVLTDARDAAPPNNIVLLIQATGVPIDHNSYDTVENLRDMTADWPGSRGEPLVLLQLGEAGSKHVVANPPY